MDTSKLSTLLALVAARKAAGKAVAGSDVVSVDTIKVGKDEKPTTVIRFNDRANNRKPFGCGPQRLAAVLPHMDAALAFAQQTGLTVQEFTAGQLEVIRANVDAATQAAIGILEAASK